MDVVVEFVEIALFGCGLIAWARLAVGGWDVGFAAACSCSLGGVAHSEVVLFVCVFYCFGFIVFWLSFHRYIHNYRERIENWALGH